MVGIRSPGSNSSSVADVLEVDGAAVDLALVGHLRQLGEGVGHLLAAHSGTLDAVEEKQWNGHGLVLSERTWVALHR